MFWKQYWESVAQGETPLFYRKKKQPMNHRNNFWKALGDRLEEFMKTGLWQW